MYSLAIGDRTYSSWSLRGWLMFAKFDLPVTVESARMYTPEFTELLARYGGGRTVPAMRFDNVLVSDTLAMAETLAERHPDKSMWPTDPVARGYARSIVALMHSGFTELRSHCTMNLRHCYEGFIPPESVISNLKELDKIWNKARSDFGKSGPWLFGEYSLADVFYAPVATRILTYGLPVSEVSQAYVNQTINDPTFKKWRADGLAENYIQPSYDLDLSTTLWPVA